MRPTRKFHTCPCCDCEFYWRSSCPHCGYTEFSALGDYRHYAKKRDVRCTRCGKRIHKAGEYGTAYVCGNDYDGFICSECVTEADIQNEDE